MIFDKFSGMNNIKKAEGEPNQPSVVFNSYVTPQGRVLPKEGYSSFVSLPHTRNLYGGSVFLAVAEDKLYRIDDRVATELCQIKTHGSDVSYVEENNKIYISCVGWTGIYDLANKEIVVWGMDVPDAPVIKGRSGDLPPGTYSICYTNINAEGRISGNSPVVRFTFENQTMGISLINRPENTLCWMTDTNGGEFFLVGNTDNISSITSPYNTVPLPSFGVIPPPKMTCIFLAFGRIWGISGKCLVFSEPFVYEWFKASNKITFPELPIMAGHTASGLFVNSESLTWTLAGTDPSKMIIQQIGEGGVRGILTYHNKKDPVWINKKGIIALSSQLERKNLTGESLNIPVSEIGSALTLMSDGIQQILITLKIPKNMSTDLGAIFEEGRLNRTNVTGVGGITVG